VADALEAAQRRLREEFGITCFVQSDATVYYPPDHGAKLDQQIIARRVTEGWLMPDLLWVGSREDAAAAFRADAVYGDEHHTWMLFLGGSPRALELVGTTTPSGRTVWVTLNSVVPCGSSG
jgi:hypothetical protein